jgi:hypothetical protein
MKTFGLLVRKTSGPHEVRIPGARLARVNQSLRRRLDDEIEAVFNRACATNDLEAAADLLTLMEKWHARRPAGHGHERRTGGEHLRRVRKQLERVSGLRGAVVPAAEVKLGDPREAA